MMPFLVIQLLWLLFPTAFAYYNCDNLSEMLKGLVKATVPVVKLGVKVGLCGGAVYATKEVAAKLFKPHKSVCPVPSSSDTA